jgi:O-antigen/teichoic acid export membrane protein
MIKNRLFGHAAIYTLSNFAVAGVPFLLLPVLTRVLDPAAYGVVAMFSMVVAFISIFVGLNVHGAISVRYLDNSKFDIPTYVSSSLALLAISSILMLIFISIAGGILSDLTAIPVKWLYIAVLVAFLQFIVQVLLALWQASKKPVRYGTMRLSNALLDGGGSIALVVVLSLSWQGRIAGMLAAWMCVAIVAAYYLIREGWLAKSVDTAYVKDALSYGVPLIPHAVGGVMLGMADRFMVNTILDVSSTGIYVVAVQLGLILGMLADSFNKAFAPWLMEKLASISPETQSRIVRFTYAYFLAIFFLAILGGIIVRLLLPLLVGPEFQSAGDILIYILIGNAFMGMYYMVTNYIFFSRRTGLLSTLTMSVGALTVLSSWFLIKAYGLTGAAIGFMLGQAGLFLGAWLLSNLCVPMPWFRALTSKAILR